MLNLFEEQKIAYSYRNHHIYTGKAVFPDGRKYDWTTVDFQNSVSILPYNKNNGKLILLKQYRPSIKQWSIEQVAGGIEKELTVLENAKKEVLEEIGYKLDDEDIFFLGKFYVTPGLMNFVTYFFAAECSEEKFVGQHLEETEIIETFEIEQEEFMKLIFDDTIVDPEILISLQLIGSFDLSRRCLIDKNKKMKNVFDEVL